MKHGRRHNRLKEKAYEERKDAEGYARPYRPMPLDADGRPPAPRAPPPPPPPPETPLGAALGRRAKRDLKRLGLDPDSPED